MRHLRHALVAAFAAVSLLACGESASTGSSPEGLPPLSERQIYDTGEIPELDRVVVIRLEPPGRERQPGDLGGTGDDSYRVAVSEATTTRFRIAPEDQEHFSASLIDPEGRVVVALDTDSPTQTAELSTGEYLMQIARLSVGERDLIVFFRDGEFSRSCERCNLHALQAGSSDLSGASFRGADLTNAVLAAASCVGTDFRGADLDEAMLSGSDSRDATFAGADLTATSLLGADVTGAELTNAQRESMNDLPTGASALGTTAAFEAQNVTVTAGHPLVISSEDGGATAVNIGTLTVQEGGQVQIRTSAHLTVQSLVVEGNDSSPNFVIVGAPGTDGPNGENVAPPAVCHWDEIPNPNDGGDGVPGTDGHPAPFASVLVGTVSGLVDIEVRGGAGGGGGNGGAGLAGGNGGSGGVGGNGGLGSEVTVYYQSLASAEFRANSQEAVGGPGGPGGAAGAGLPEAGASPACDPGQSGPPGVMGSPGGPSRIVILQTPG